jgi:hypothetical protein
MKYADTLTKKRLCTAGKIWFEFPLAIFSPSTLSVKVEQLLIGLRGKKKTEGEKISFIRGKIYHIFSPSRNAQILSQKKIVSSGKNMIFNFPLAIFSSSTPSVNVEQLLHGLWGKK